MTDNGEKELPFGKDIIHFCYFHSDLLPFLHLKLHLEMQVMNILFLINCSKFQVPEVFQSNKSKAEALGML